MGDLGADLATAVTTDAFRRDPYPLYKSFLATPGWCSPSGYRVFSRYDDVMTVLRQPAAFGQEGVPYPNFHVLDPPDHTRIRRLVAKVFTAPAIAKQEADVSAMVDDLVDRVAGDGSMDVITDFALHLPARVAARMLDVPVEDADQWHRWLYEIGGFRGKVWYVGPLGIPEDRERARQAARASASYFDDLIGQRESTQGNDIVCALLETRQGGDRLTREEVLFSLVLILGGGLHTTASQIGNTVRALLETPGALDRVIADPGLVDNAVEEGLRYDPALQVEYRVTREPVAVGELELEADTPVMIVNAAANRDPAVFEDPQVFDVERSNAAQHLTFGWGIHRCLGAQLARLELRLAIRTLVTRLQGLRLAGAPIQHEFDRWRGLATLPVAWDSAT